MTIEQHTETINKATTWARELTSANLDEWNPQGEKNGVKIYTQEDGKLIRGDYLFKTSLFTYEEYAAVTSSTIIRNMWDASFDKSEQRLMAGSKEGLFWVKCKTPWPITPRDFCLYAKVEHCESENAIRTTMVSVKDDKAIPPVHGCVRATLHIVAWYIRKDPQGVAITYVNKTDLEGSLPVSFTKLVTSQIPLTVVRAADFMNKYGFPPMHRSACIKKESIDQKKMAYEATIKTDKPEDVVWDVAKQMYPKGVAIKTSPAALQDKVQVQTSKNGHYRVTLLQVNQPVTITMTKK
ncbi:Bet v1-like protein [Lichtheimia hyalospora FSU 10163]|nr:Bet v1-like protein [Lichtheimia hyalospora FSU 10163]